MKSANTTNISEAHPGDQSEGRDPSTGMTLNEALAACNVSITPDPSQPKQRKDAEYLFLRTETFEGKPLLKANFGNFRTGKEGSWTGGLEQLGEVDQQKALKHLAEKSKAMKEMQREVWAEVAVEAQRFIKEETVDRGSHPYLTRKQIPELLGARIQPNEHGGVLIIEMKDVDNKIWNYQRIYSEKLSKGDKFFLPGGRIEGTFFTFGELNEKTETVYIGEGFATCASIYLALNRQATVVAAFNAGNLDSVGSAIRAKYPNVKIVFCADNDAFTVINGQHVNVGLHKARAAAGNCQGEVRWPVFPERLWEHKPTDFNDVHCTMGLEFVKEMIEWPEKYKKPGEIIPIISKSKPSEIALARTVIAEFKDRLIRERNDLFVYTGTHWKLVDEAGIISFRNMLRAASTFPLGDRDVSAAYRTLLDLVPYVPQGFSLFTPNPWVATQVGTPGRRIPQGIARQGNDHKDGGELLPLLESSYF